MSFDNPKISNTPGYASASGEDALSALTVNTPEVSRRDALLRVLPAAGVVTGLLGGAGDASAQTVAATLDLPWPGGKSDSDDGTIRLTGTSTTNAADKSVTTTLSATGKYNLLGWPNLQFENPSAVMKSTVTKPSPRLTVSGNLWVKNTKNSGWIIFVYNLTSKTWSIDAFYGEITNPISLSDLSLLSLAGGLPAIPGLATGLTISSGWIYFVRGVSVDLIDSKSLTLKVSSQNPGTLSWAPVFGLNGKASVHRAFDVARVAANVWFNAKASTNGKVQIDGGGLNAISEVTSSAAQKLSPITLGSASNIDLGEYGTLKLAGSVMTLSLETVARNNGAPTGFGSSPNTFRQELYGNVDGFHIKLVDSGEMANLTSYSQAKAIAALAANGKAELLKALTRPEDWISYLKAGRIYLPVLNGKTPTTADISGLLQKLSFGGVKASATVADNLASTVQGIATDPSGAVVGVANVVLSTITGVLTAVGKATDPTNW